MLLAVEEVTKSYRQPGQSLFSGRRKTVLSEVSLNLAAGETLALVGESGSGKSTLARLILGLEKPDQGRITIAGQSVLDRSVRRQHLSAVFQDYSSSINPSQTVFEAIAEPLRLAGQKKPQAQVLELMDRMRLSADLRKRRPHELSGGQAQRVCLTRAMATEPSLIVLDEALSSLDVPAQVAMLELLAELRQGSTAYLFISHDLQSVAYLCDRVVFLKNGRIRAESLVKDLAQVNDPYAKQLLNAALPF